MRWGAVVLCSLIFGCGRAPLLGSRSDTNPTPTPDITPNPNGGYGIPLTIAGSRIPDDLSQFPVWVSLGRAELKDVASGGHVLHADGSDLSFQQNGVPLPTELVTYDPSKGEVLAWVRLDLTAGQDETFSLYYGEEGLVSQSGGPAADVWSDPFVAVWHLENEVSGVGNMGAIHDSTAHQLDADDFTTATGAEGQVGRSASFDSDSDHLRITGADNELDQGGLNADRLDFTIQTWARVSTHTGDWDTLYEKGVVTGNSGGYGFYYERTTGTPTVAIYLQNNGGNQTRLQVSYDPSLDVWHHVAAVVERGDPNRAEFFVDGVSIGTDSQGGIENDRVNTNGIATIGQNTNQNNCCALRGNIDELWISNGVRTAEWISTVYDNQSDPSGFVTAGPEVPFF